VKSTHHHNTPSLYLNTIQKTVLLFIYLFIYILVLHTSPTFFWSHIIPSQSRGREQDDERRRRRRQHIPIQAAVDIIYVVYI
jgi:hypothetical protein